MPTKAFKFYRIPAQAPYQRPSFDLGLHPSILGGSVRLGTALLRDRNWERRPVPKISQYWYQTETQVVVEVRIKKLKADECKIEIGDTDLSVTAPLPTGSEYSLELDLAHPVFLLNPDTKFFQPKSRYSWRRRKVFVGQLLRETEDHRCLEELFQLQLQEV